MGSRASYRRGQGSQTARGARQTPALAPGDMVEVDGLPAHPSATRPGEGVRAPSAMILLLCDHRGGGLDRLRIPLEGAGFLVRPSASLRETREQAQRERPDLIVVDPLAEGGSVELEELERLRGETRPVPLLLVADPADPSAAVRATRALSPRAWDLVRRDAPLEEILLRIERLLAGARENTELEELRYRAAHDDRTELLRPRAFQQRLGEHFSAAQRHDFELALVVLDLDDFGRINKDFDHTVGDLVIARVGEAIRRSMRAEDVAGRLGGDEFAVLLPYTGPVEAAHAVRRLCERLRALSGPVPGFEEEVPVRASLGFETYGQGRPASLADLRQHAELALRQAKTSGGDRGIYYRSLR